MMLLAHVLLTGQPGRDGIAPEPLCRMHVGLLSNTNGAGTDPSKRILLEELLADADLASLGMASYWQWSGLLRAEWATFGTAFDDEGWQRGQVAFLSSHRYWTRAAQTLLEPVKQQHLAHLRGELYEREA